MFKKYVEHEADKLDMNKTLVVEFVESDSSYVCAVTDEAIHLNKDFANTKLPVLESNQKDTPPPPVHGRLDRIARKRSKRKIFCIRRTFTRNTTRSSVDEEGGGCL